MMEETKFYRPILKKAWDITMKFKSLWFLGFFAALISSGGEFELLSRIIFSPTANKGFIGEAFKGFQEGIQNNLPAGGNIWSNLWSVITSAPVNIISAILVLVVAIIIALFVIWLTTVSQVGLIRNTDLATKNKKSTINEGIDAGVENFWPIFTVNVVYKFILLIIFVLLGQEIYLLVSMGNIGTILHIILLVIFSIITVIISFIIRYQILYIILKKEKIIPALKSAWKLFITNWLLSLEMAFILFIIYMIIIYLTTFATSVLLAVPLVFATYSTQIPVLVLMALVLTAVVSIIAITILITALLSVFQWSAWVLLFNKMSTEKTLSKIVKLSEQSPTIPNIFNKK